MSEGQRLEWKTAWRDDHLRSVCAFANADSGTLYIGLDDNGLVVGVGARERRRLLEELPNKLRDLLGIVASVTVEEEDGVPYLRITVEPYPVPISYRASATSAAEARTRRSAAPRWPVSCSDRRRRPEGPRAGQAGTVFGLASSGSFSVGVRVWVPLWVEIGSSPPRTVRLRVRFPGGPADPPF